MPLLWSLITVGGALWLSVSSAFALEFSAKQTTRTGAQSMSGKIYFQSDRWRVEMASPDGLKVAIHRLDKLVTWLLLPDRKYVEMPLRIDQLPQVAPKIPGEVERTRVGTDLVGGRKTEKYRVALDLNGQKQVLYQWVAPDIQFSMKLASLDGSWESAFDHVAFNRQPPHLFELPAGYTKVPMQR
jgi:hypothetical protein